MSHINLVIANIAESGRVARGKEECITSLSIARKQKTKNKVVMTTNKEDCEHLLYEILEHYPAAGKV